MMLNTVWVPEDARAPQMEICHAFAYRYLLAAGKIAEDPSCDPLIGPFNGGVMAPILWPGGMASGAPVRVGGANRVSAGDLIGFFEGNGALAHSMIAQSPVCWVSANNQGCFGTGVGRSTIPDVYADHAPVGFVNALDNRVRSMGGELVAVFRTP